MNDDLSPSDRDPWELVAESFLARYRSGERPSIEEYATRHPELADRIRRLMPALIQIEQDLSIDPVPAPVRSRPRAAEAAAGAGESRRLGDYQILREIGRGGMGVVFEAEQVSLGRRVALKVLPGHVAGDGKALERFRREAKAAAGLHHTNIVPVFEVGQAGATAYYAMQFIQGQGLDQIIDELVRLRDGGGMGNAMSPGPTTAISAPDPGKPVLAGVCDPGDPPITGLTEAGYNDAGYNAGPTANDGLSRVAELVVSGRVATDGTVPLSANTAGPAGSAVTDPMAPGPTSQAKGRQGADAPRSPLGTACPGERGASAKGRQGADAPRSPRSAVGAPVHRAFHPMAHRRRLSEGF